MPLTTTGETPPHEAACPDERFAAHARRSTSAPWPSCGLDARRDVKKQLKSYSARLRARLFTDAADEATTVFLLSSGRSGSTWLSEMLQSIPSTRTIFEPFHATRGYHELAEHRYRYLPPEQENAALLETLSDVLAGRRRSAWSDQFNPLIPTTFRRRLVKEVRANLLSPWLTRALPAARFLFLVRHPIPLALSQLKGGWVLSSQRLHDQAELAGHYGLDRFSRFGWPTEGFESLVLFWAIENLVALDCAERSGALLIRYEDLVLRPGASLASIGRHIGVEFTEQVRDSFSETSWSSRKGVGDLSPAEKVNRWQRVASPSQVDFVAAVLEACELGGLYAADGVDVTA